MREPVLLAARTQLADLWRNENHVSDSDRRQLELPVLPEATITLPHQAPHFTGAVLRAHTTHAGPIPQALGEPHHTTYERRGNGYVPMLEAVTRAITDGLTEHPTHPLADSVATLEVLVAFLTLA